MTDKTQRICHLSRNVVIYLRVDPALVPGREGGGGGSWTVPGGEGDFPIITWQRRMECIDLDGLIWAERKPSYHNIRQHVA